MKNTVISSSKYEMWYTAVNACNALAIANSLVELIPDMLQDLNLVADEGEGLRFLVNARDMLDTHSQRSDAKWTWDEHLKEAVPPLGYPGSDLVIQSLFHLNGATNGAESDGLWYEYSHPLMIVGMQILANIMNAERECYIVRINDKRWSRAYEQVEFHAGVEEVVERDGGVTLVMGECSYRKRLGYEQQDWWAKLMLRAWSGRWIGLEAVTLDASQQRVSIDGRYYE